MPSFGSTFSRLPRGGSTPLFLSRLLISSIQITLLNFKYDTGGGAARRIHRGILLHRQFAQLSGSRHIKFCKHGPGYPYLAKYGKLFIDKSLKRSGQNPVRPWTVLVSSRSLLFGDMSLCSDPFSYGHIELKKSGSMSVTIARPPTLLSLPTRLVPG
jgi:hypothetical protein